MHRINIQPLRPVAILPVDRYYFTHPRPLRRRHADAIDGDIRLPEGDNEEEMDIQGRRERPLHGLNRAQLPSSPLVVCDSFGASRPQ